MSTGSRFRTPLTVAALAALAALAPAQKSEARPAAGEHGADVATTGVAPQDRVAAWNDFQQRHPGDWAAHWNAATGTPQAIFGSGLPIADWRGSSLEEARRHAMAVLHDEAALLGLGTSSFRERIGSRMGRTWSFVFEQTFRELPVIGGRADVRVSMNGRIAMFGSAAFAVPEDFDITPTVNSQTASMIAFSTMPARLSVAPQPAPVQPPRLVLWGDVHASVRSPIHLAWEVAVSNVDREGRGTIGRYYLDARTGAVLQFVNDKHECGPDCTHGKAGSGGEAVVATAAPASPALPVPTTVQVSAYARLGLDANSPIGLVQVPGLQVNVPGVGTMVTDQNGRFVIDIAAPVGITIGALDGRHHAPISGAAWPGGTFTVNPGGNHSLVLLSPTATPAQLAHTNTTWWVDRANEWARQTLGNSPQMAAVDGITPTVNRTSGACNAYYVANTINFYAAGNGCLNTAFATVIAHELGHGIDDQYGGMSQVDGLSEGWADVVAMYLTDQPDIGVGIHGNGVPLRTGNNNRQYPSGATPHEQGESWMGFAWLLRDDLALRLNSRSQAVQLTNDIVFGTIVANATTQPAAVLEVFLADDNDGMLNNGTPNEDALVQACRRHSLPTPLLTGPANDYCPGAITVVPGINGPFSSHGATATLANWLCSGSAANNDVWFKFITQWPGQLTVSTCGQTALDTRLQLSSGSCGALTRLACNDDACGTQSSVSYYVGAGTHYIQVGAATSGQFSLEVDFVGPIQAASAPHGAGCGTASKAFYELFPPGTFDLAGGSLRLVNRGTHYVAQPGGTFLPLSSNTFRTSHGDDSVLNFVLSTPLPYPGGSSQTLEVCSNGYVSVGAGNPVLFQPTAAAWLGSARARWGTWHDFNPTAAGSGRIHYDIVGQIAYVTWNGVYTFGTTTPNTWQIQFDQSNGDVTMVWQAMPLPGLPTLVGYAAQGPNLDLGNMDLSTALPGTFITGAYNGQALTLAGTLPQLGSTLVLTTTNFPATTLFGIQTLGIQGYFNGIDLRSMGMPGCRQYSEVLSISSLVPAGGQAVYSLGVPASLSFTGMQLKAQSAAFVPGANPLGAIASNGVWMTVGI
ncbi:MAG: hypothetical protein IPK26_03160 [Planctomycetes bacterium]|nr:hypothetical protein [Planctomycetota bacterium]